MGQNQVKRGYVQAITGRISERDLRTERVGFEPTVPEGTTVFETVRFNHSRTSPVTVVRCLDRRCRPGRQFPASP